MSRVAQTGRRPGLIGLTLAMTAAGLLTAGFQVGSAPRPAAPPSNTACPAGAAGITLSPGFCATVFADDLGHVRHMTVAPDGVLYVNTWSGRYFPNRPPPPGGFLIALKDTRGAGRADVVRRFGPTAASGAAGGSGLAYYRGRLYAEDGDRIVRYDLRPGAMVPAGPAEVVLSGMPLTGDHPMHPFIIDPGGRILVDMGSATNACQIRNREARSPGAEPCLEKRTRAGIWVYDANRLGQRFSPRERFVSGLRNGEGLAFDGQGRLFATQHGRDQLPQNWADLYPDLKRATELPSEELVELKPGADYGWPECYHDPFRKRLVLAPEYGGDGGGKIGVCTTRTEPIAVFPSHWAPNDLMIPKGAAFARAYRGGAFIAFHGSWNRAPAPQGGYNIVFQPLEQGRAAGDFIVFADGFAGAHKDPGRAAFRPTGLAEAPDGALFISDDVRGRIWRVTYEGPPGADRIAPAPAPSAAPETASPPEIPPENNLPVPPGSSETQVLAGRRIYHAASCTGCHGPDARGTPVGPDLGAGSWIWSDGSLSGIRAVIARGVPDPKRYRSPMPAMGGERLTPEALSAVAAYVWAVGHTPH